MSLDQATVIATLPRNDREEVRIGLAQYKGRTRLDIRVWYLAGEEFRPGKQGISLPLEQLTALRDAIADVQTRIRSTEKEAGQVAMEERS